VSGPERVWIPTPIDAEAADRLARALDLPGPIARLLVARGVAEPEAARRYLAPRLADMPDPSLLRGLDRAAERLARAILDGERVALYGDYDVDGVTSSTLLSLFLSHHGLEPRVYIPHRLREGYGLNADAVDQLAEEATQVLVTLDCGITAADEIARAGALGMEVIVVDHHRCPPELPPAYATLNPHQPDCAYPEKVLAAVGVAFNLIVGVRRELRKRGAYEGRFAEPNLRDALDLVALGTIADMVPLTGVNRMMAHYGLQAMREVRRPGLRALMEVAGVRPTRVTGQDVAFRLGPRINAAGRLDDASVGVRLLTAGTSEAARPLAERLDVANSDRRRIEAEVFASAVEQVEARDAAGHAIVVHDDAWHPGVVGIVASKLVERFERPAVVIGEGGRGSARTAGALHLYDALAACSGHLVKFGGHRAAAGLRIESARIDAFRADLDAAVAAAKAAGADASVPLRYDLDLEPSEVDRALALGVARLEPFGIGNPEPTFRLLGVGVRECRIVGQHHLKLRLDGGRAPLDAIAFRFAEREDEVGAGPLDLAGHLEINEFGGYERVELRVRDFRRTAGPESAVA
jgi:single-stranded-DNA-specific exonuclease